jgi:hypothetical protein
LNFNNISFSYIILVILVIVDNKLKRGFSKVYYNNFSNNYILISYYYLYRKTLLEINIILKLYLILIIFPLNFKLILDLSKINL